MRLKPDVITDKAFDILIGAPLGAAATAAMGMLVNWQRWEIYFIGACVCLAVCGIIEAIKWETRRRAVGLRRIFLSHAGDIKHSPANDVARRIQYANAAIRGALGESAAMEFRLSLPNGEPEVEKRLAAAYLEGLANRVESDRQSPSWFAKQKSAPAIS
jgi:hypothetical protein